MDRFGESEGVDRIIEGRQRPDVRTWSEEPNFRRLQLKITQAIRSYAIEDLMQFIREDISDAFYCGEIDCQQHDYLMHATGKPKAA